MPLVACHYNFNLISPFFQPLEVAADLDSEAGCRKLIEATIAHYGKLDILVNNAAEFNKTSNADQSDCMDTFDQVMRTNLRNTLYLCHLAIPELVKTKGAIVNVSSVASFKPVRNCIYFPLFYFILFYNYIQIYIQI